MKQMSINGASSNNQCLPAPKGRTWPRRVTSLSMILGIWLGSSVAGQAFKFAAFGDVRGEGTNTPANPIVSVPVMQAFAKAVQADGVDFVIVNGDLITGQVAWSKTNMTLPEMLGIWTNTMTEFTSRGVAVHSMRGNHELYWMGNGPAPTEAWLETLGHSLPQNGPPGEQGFTYSFTHSNALFLCVDQYGGTNSHLGKPYPKVNTTWLEQQLKTNTQKHVFVFGHEPCFQMVMSCLSHEASSRTAFWHCMSTNGVPLYFCGHDHFYVRAKASISNSPPMQQVLVGGCTYDLMSWPGKYPEQGSNGVSIQTEAYYGLEGEQCFYRLLTASTNVMATGLTPQGYLLWTNVGAAEDLVVVRKSGLQVPDWTVCLRRPAPTNGLPVKITNLQPTYGYMLMEVNGTQVHGCYKTSHDMQTWELTDQFSYEIP